MKQNEPDYNIFEPSENGGRENHPCDEDEPCPDCCLVLNPITEWPCIYVNGHPGKHIDIWGKEYEDGPCLKEKLKEEAEEEKRLQKSWGATRLGPGEYTYRGYRVFKDDKWKNHPYLGKGFKWSFQPLAGGNAEPAKSKKYAMDCVDELLDW